jgi:hypothetical protein
MAKTRAKPTPQLGGAFDFVTSRLIRSLADRTADGWRNPDSGMWEARDAERHYSPQSGCAGTLPTAP